MPGWVVSGTYIRKAPVGLLLLFFIFSRRRHLSEGVDSLRQTLVKSDPDVVLLDLIKHLISIGVSISLSVIDWDNACIQREDEVYRGHD